MDPITGAFLALAGFNLISSFAQAEGQRQQARVQQNLFDINSKLSEVASDQALKRGEETAIRVEGTRRQVESAANVALASQGIEIGSGSAAQLQAATDYISAVDQRQIRNNAWMEAWGIRANALGQQFQGQLAGLAGRNQAQNTLTAGLFQASEMVVRGFAAGG